MLFGNGRDINYIKTLTNFEVRTGSTKPHITYVAKNVNLRWAIFKNMEKINACISKYYSPLDKHCLCWQVITMLCEYLVLYNLNFASPVNSPHLTYLIRTTV